MSWQDSTTDRDTPGKARRRAKDFDPKTRGGPAESRRDGDDWLMRGFGSKEWSRWRRVDKDLWEVNE